MITEYTEKQLNVWKRLRFTVTDADGMIVRNDARLSEELIYEALQLHAARRANKQGTEWYIGRNCHVWTVNSESLRKALRAAEKQLKAEVSKGGKAAMDLAQQVRTGHAIGDCGCIIGWDWEGAQAVYVIHDETANDYIRIFRDANGDLTALN